MGALDSVFGKGKRITGFGESFDDLSDRVINGGGANYSDREGVMDREEYLDKGETLGARRRIDHGHPGPTETYQPKTHEGRLLDPAIKRPEETVDPFREQYRRRGTE